MTDAALAKRQLPVAVGGRKLNLYCCGANATTVVFDAPSGDGGCRGIRFSQKWPGMRTCVYDPARIGFSIPAPRPNTSMNAVKNLYKALAAAGIKPHYLMVGNSLGGGNAQAYAYCYPRRSTAWSSSNRRQKTNLRA